MSCQVSSSSSKPQEERQRGGFQKAEGRGDRKSLEIPQRPQVSKTLSHLIRRIQEGQNGGGEKGAATLIDDTDAEAGQ